MKDHEAVPLPAASPALGLRIAPSFPCKSAIEFVERLWIRDRPSGSARARRERFFVVLKLQTLPHRDEVSPGIAKYQSISAQM